jgi:hypothetical protein
MVEESAKARNINHRRIFQEVQFLERITQWVELYVTIPQALQQVPVRNGPPDAKRAEEPA